ncbi:thiamine phosphate synthase [Sediminicurvatus halobius]|uniref:Thiamine-phosphate synthase n=1 Tax=Sediminicurvatus halobius TaxID=2182432 RepID=A0A2U2N0L8_9GAMM|nr:thiamine phosphate synthase [Spiribacter halobius]PWG62504.1 thiamine phosphate synthase [Spiribacter halobius]UEX78598.1 thiamine phosphate synthase [Spiribacter halobius]
MTSPIRGLYAITDSALQPPERLVDAVAAAVRGGARVVQYRDKSADHARRRKEAAALAALCRQAGACFIVNDDIEFAAAVGADGVHVGRDDAELAAARARLGGEAIIGVSCYDDLERARRLAAAGADYLAFGSVFPSATKPDAVRAPLGLFREARAFTQLPLVAIGGIDAGNIAEVARAGADAAAVIRAVFGADDVEAAARRLAASFELRV